MTSEPLRDPPLPPQESTEENGGFRLRAPFWFHAGVGVKASLCIQCSKNKSQAQGDLLVRLQTHPFPTVFFNQINSQKHPDGKPPANFLRVNSMGTHSSGDAKKKHLTHLISFPTEENTIMGKVETLLRTASALLLIVHNQLGNFNFFQQTSVISEEVEIHLQIPVSLLAALMLSIGGVHRKSHDTRDGPWHENPAPCQYLNRKSVVGNLKQQVFPLRKKKSISTY